MSSNRLKYDQCSYTTDISQSVGPLGYVLNPMKYENCHKCRHEFGLLGGTAVSHIKGNMVDLENDLRGATRLASKCPTNKYKPSNSNVLILPGNPCNKQRTVDLSKVHLPSCQTIPLPPRVLPPCQTYSSCPAPPVYVEPPCSR
jgi:hypothetical protein